ncbi:MAG TPA: hypothetical protein VFE68_04050 [Vicinamibacteria bacterium]|nr:hypothetical protein [Vicinamibacteria bacterium]
MAGKFLHGALVQFMDTFLIPLPNVIIFQFNPETITHTWSPAQAAGGSGPTANPLAVKGTPGESFSFSLAMDSNDMIADGSPVAEGIAVVSGVYTRLAALEMLLYPTASPTDGLLGAVSVSAAGIGGSAAAGGVKRDVPAAQLPTVLFVWGPGRILPVKVTGLAITERLYDPLLLNPIHAEAQIGLQVLTPEELKYVTGPLADLANVAYTYSQGLRQVLAIANLANSVESVIGMLPV